jgi:hypothetical protein
MQQSRKGRDSKLRRYLNEMNVKIFFDLFPFAPNQERLGNLFVEAVNLSIEQGVTRASGTAGVVSMNNSIASVVKQATVDAAAIRQVA